MEFEVCLKDGVKFVIPDRLDDGEFLVFSM